MENGEKKKGSYSYRTGTLVVSVLALLATIPLKGINSCSSSFGVRSLEEHAKYGESGNSVSPELQKQWVEMAEQVVAGMKDQGPCLFLQNQPPPFLLSFR